MQEKRFLYFALGVGILFAVGATPGVAEGPDSISTIGTPANELALERPVTVSPGGETEVVLVGGRCPAFSWGSVEGATDLELVVYALDEASGGSALDLSAIRKALDVRIPGGASVWTPPLAKCLEPGGSYAWTVRARTGAAWSDWSEARLFRVDPGPSTAEVERALETLSRFLAARGAAPVVAEPVSGRVTAEPVAGTSALEPSPEQLIDTGNADDTALEAESAAAAGKTFGIHGISTSSGAESAGVVGDATSAAGFGGIFKNSAGGGAGLLAVGGGGFDPDIVLGNTGCTTSGDNGFIVSDPVCPGSDIFLSAGDLLAVRIGETVGQSGNFVVQAVQDSDSVRREIFNIDESGEILLGVANTSRTRLTKTGLEVNLGGSSGSRSFNFSNAGSGAMNLEVNGVPVVTAGVGTPRIYERSVTTGSGGSWDFGNIRIEATAVDRWIKICNQSGASRYFLRSLSGTETLFQLSNGSCTSSTFVGTPNYFRVTGANTHIVGIGTSSTSKTYEVVSIGE